MKNEELLKLLRETVMRNHMALPENSQDEKWFDEGCSMKDTPDFLITVYKTIGLGHYTARKNSRE